MKYDPDTEQPYFDFKTITKSKTESRRLEDKLPYDNRKFFFWQRLCDSV